jgi:GT2 family glycosyltransferase
MSADDWLHPENISVKVKKLMEDPEVALVSSNMYLYYTDTGKMVKEPANIPAYGSVFDSLIASNFIAAPGWVLDLEKMKEIGYFSEHIKLDDWDLVLRLSQKYKIVFVDQFLVYYRRHTTNASNPRNLEYYKDQLTVLEQYKGHKNYKRSKEKILKQLVYNSIIVDPSRKSFLLLIKEFKFEGFYFKQMVRLLFLGIKKMVGC